MTPWLNRLTGGVLGAAALAFTINTASAQTSANADSVYNGFVSAYLVTTHVNGYTYPLPYICQSIANKDMAWFWQQAYLISGMEDAEDKNIGTNRLNTLHSLLTAFVAQNGTTYTDFDGWNDDVEWADIALAHGYQETGDTAFLNAATNSWNNVYNRGWNSNLGGGILEKQTATSKCVLSNAPFIIAGCRLYRATGDSSYLTKCEQVYTWMRANCLYSTGQVIEGVDSSGPLVSNNSYNNGIFLQAADALYQVTGNSSYYNDALLVANWVVNNNTVMTQDHPNNGPFGSEEFFRGLSLFARYHNLWATYSPWMQANCQAAWDHRRTDYNLTWNKYETATPSGTNDLASMESMSSLVVQSVTEIDPSGTFEIKNAASSLSLNVSGNSTTNGAPIIQWPYSGALNSQWTFVLNTANGYHQLVSNSSGKDVAVQNASASQGAGIIQWSFGSAGNDQWLVAQTINGNYNLINLKSGMALEDPGSSTAQGTQMDQWGSNRGSNQRWALIRH
jgi:predicted alpha-1,6-mannanase (GH76 family)